MDGTIIKGEHKIGIESKLVTTRNALKAIAVETEGKYKLYMEHDTLSVACHMVTRDLTELLD